MVTTRYYYSILSEQYKKIYRAIYEGIKNHCPFVEVPGINLNNAIAEYVYRCVIWDNPYFFSVSEHATNKAVYEDGKKIKITFWCDPNMEKVCKEHVQTVINEIMNTPGLNGLSDFQKEIFVHDFILNNVEYDPTCENDGARSESYTVYGVFVEKKAGCEGISKAVKLLLNILDVKCIVVGGAVDRRNHVWNIVKMKNFEYNLDVALDMLCMAHQGVMRYDYFNFRAVDDPGRTWNGDHILPECTAIEYNYVIKAGGFVSSYDRLVMYMVRCLKKKKNCMYIKVNFNVPSEFQKMGKFQFRDVITKALDESQKRTGIYCNSFLDDSGKMGIYNLEISYV